MRTKMGFGGMVCVACLVALLAAGTGCHKGKEPAINPDLVSTRDTTTETRGDDGLPGIDLDDLLFGPTGLEVVYFDFDSYALRADAREALQRNSDKVKQARGVVIQIEGHCDERGTQDYNLALGERRALAVREYLMNLGVSGDRMITISYGEEMPAVPGSNESAWSKNRRSEFNKAL